MTLLFLRHAEAESFAAGDFQRILTPKGREQATRVGKFLSRTALLPEIILTSPVIRAQQTADLVASKLDCPSPVLSPWLACVMSPATCLDELTPYSALERILLVGHEPDFSTVISELVGCPRPGGIRVRKASLTAIGVQTLRAGQGELQFAIPVRMM